MPQARNRKILAWRDWTTSWFEIEDTPKNNLWIKSMLPKLSMQSASRGNTSISEAQCMKKNLSSVFAETFPK